MTEHTDILTAALDYVGRGWAVVPLHWIAEGGQCSCGRTQDDHARRQGGKHPLWREWTTALVRDDAGVTRVWGAGGVRPQANIGLATGAPSGWWALDVDPDNAGDASLAELVAMLGGLPATRTHRTGSGGTHYLFALPEDFAPTNRRGALPRGLDVRGNGGQIVAPPSRSGKGAYVVTLDAPILPAPAWLTELIRPSEQGMEHDETTARHHETPAGTDRLSRYAHAAVAGECAQLASAPAGARNETAFRVACRLIELCNASWSGLHPDDVERVYHAAAAAASLAGGEHGFSWAEATAVWRNAGRRVGATAAAAPLDPMAGATVALPPLPFWPAPAPDATRAADQWATPAGMPAIADPGASGALAPFAGVGAADALPAEDVHTDPVAAMLAELLDVAGLAKLPRPAPLVAGMLQANSLARISGPSGAGKTFVALDLALCVASGLAWHGHEVSRGKVIIIEAEDASGLYARIRAWERHHGRDADGLLVLPRPVQVAPGGRVGPEWATWIEVCRAVGPALIVFDTQARATVGVEENSATEMGPVIELLECLRRATGACVMLVHHTGVNGERARGSSAVRGAMTTELLLGADREVLTLRLDKQKDGPGWPHVPDLRMRLAPVVLDETGPDGEPLASVVPVQDLAALAAGIGLTPEELTSLAGQLAQLCAEAYHTRTGGTKAEIKATAMAERKITSSRSSFHRMWNEVVTRRIIGKIPGTMCWRYIAIEDRLGAVAGDGDPDNPDFVYAP